MRSPNSSVLQGRLPADLGNAVSDAIYTATGKGMEMDEASCVVLTVVCDYARRSYGDAYLDQLAHLIMAQKGRQVGNE